PEALFGRLQGRFLDVGEPHRKATLVQLFRDRQPDAAGGAGDDGDVGLLQLHPRLTRRSWNGTSRSTDGSRGRPRTRSPRMLRWISFVPPAMLVIKVSRARSARSAPSPSTHASAAAPCRSSSRSR